MDINNVDDIFYNPETEINEIQTNEIHMHQINRGVKKSQIIITGLIFKTDSESKEFLSMIQKNYGINGSYKMNKEYDDKYKVFKFTGRNRDSIRNILITKYGKNEEIIKYFG